MIWLFLAVAWFLQLHFLTQSTWLGVAWPMFVTVVLLISPKLDKLKLSWLLLFLGVLADLSSHLRTGLVLRGYLFLIIIIWFLPVLNSYLNKIKYSNIFKFLTLILIIDLFYLAQSTSWNSFDLILSHELILVSGIAFVILVFTNLFKKYFWRNNEKL